VWTKNGNTTTTRFVYDGAEIWADLTSGNVLQMRYVRGDRVLELLARISSGGTAAWILADRMGTVRNVVDNTGATIDTITYDGYGNVTNETSSANGGQYKYVGYGYEGAISPVRENRCVFACFLTQVTRQPRWREACRKAVSFLQQGV